MTDKPQVPVSLAMQDHAMMLTGTSAKKLFWDAKAMVDAIIEATEYYQPDSARLHIDWYNHEAEALGAKMIYGEHSKPTVDFGQPLIKEPGDLFKLKTPDFYRDGRLPYALECYRLMKEKKNAPALGHCSGPFSLAVALRSYPALIKDLRKRPEFARDLLDFTVDEVLLPYIKVQKEYCGVTSVSGANAWASVPGLSPEELMEWAVPWSKRLKEKALEFGITAVSQCGEYSEERLENFDAGILHRSFDVQIASTGSVSLGLLLGRWQDYPLEPVLDYTAKYRKQGKRFPIQLAVNARLLNDGPIDKIVEVIKRFIRTFVPEHELEISMHPSAGNNPDHVHAAIAAVRTYSRAPLSGNMDEIEFIPPRRESFQEWKKRMAV
ncbi:MAG TPA: uroporphyrinogen decarboxylase family protein [Dehalococcoidales bacterium]